jgi:hypothetical protein
VGDGCKFEFDAIFDAQPVKFTKEVCRKVWMAPEDNAGNSILDSLQLSQVGFRDAAENTVALVSTERHLLRADATQRKTTGHHTVLLECLYGFFTTPQHYKAIGAMLVYYFPRC